MDIDPGYVTTILSIGSVIYIGAIIAGIVYLLWLANRLVRAVEKIAER